MIFIDGIIFSLQASGGISVYFNELLSYLSRVNRCYDVALYPNNNPFAPQQTVNSEFRGSINFERFLRCNAYNNSEIFHSSYYRLPQKKYRGKVITTVHDFTDEIYPRDYKAKILSYQKRKAILNSDGIICISENTRHDLLRFIPDAKSIPMKVIYNGVGDYAIGGNEKNLPTSLYPNPYVVFVGARKKYKNFNLCVQALSAFKELSLVIVGGGDLDSEEINLLNTHLKNRYAKESFVSDEKLKNLYSHAFCLFYPSQYEGFGIPVIEAMKAGCPVIATNCSSISEIASGYAVLAEKASIENFINCIQLLFDDNLRNKLIVDGQLHAQKFSWENCFSETVRFYDEVRGLK